MELIKLIRFRDSGDQTFGMIDDELWTIERPWLDNARGVSCIPAGEYQVTRHVSPSKGECFKVHNVPDRSHILIHVANYVQDLEGCIGVGVGIDLSQEMVTSSRRALKAMLDTFDDEWTLRIINGYG